MTIDIDAAKARQEEISAERARLDREASELMYRIQREDDRPLVGRFFRRNCISKFMWDGEDDGWRVWTRVDYFDEQSGAVGTEFREAGGQWYDVKIREHCQRDYVGDEVTREEFYAAVKPMLDHLAGVALLARTT